MFSHLTLENLIKAELFQSKKISDFEVDTETVTRSLENALLLYHTLISMTCTRNYTLLSSDCQIKILKKSGVQKVGNKGVALSVGKTL